MRLELTNISFGNLSEYPILSQGSVNLSALFALKGWEDPSAKIHSAEAAEWARKQRLKMALEQYRLVPDSHRGRKLIKILNEMQSQLEDEYTYAEEKKAYYQQQIELEKKDTWTQWLWHGMQEFFDSSNVALVEKYAKIAEERQAEKQQISAWIKDLQEEITADMSAKAQSVIPVQKYIPDQTIQLNIPYSYDLSNVFAVNYDYLDVVETNKKGVPNWLTVQYQSVNSYPFPGVFAMSIIGEDKLIADGYGTLAVFNISIPSNPILLNYVKTGNPRDTNFGSIAVKNNTVFAINGAEDFVTFRMNATGYLNLSQRIYTQMYYPIISLSEDIVVIIDPGQNNTLFFDVSNPDAPQLLSNYSFPEILQDATLIGDKLYVTSGTNPILKIYNVSNYTQPLFLGQYDFTGIYIFIVLNNTGFLTGWGGTLIVNLTIPENPQLLSSVSQTGCVSVFNNLLLIGDNNNELFIYDISYLNSPRLLGNYNNIDGSEILFAIRNGHYLFAGSRNSLLTVDLRQALLQADNPQGSAGQWVSMTVRARNFTTIMASTAFTLTLDQFPNRIESSLPDQSLFPGDTLNIILNQNLIFTNPDGSFQGLSLQQVDLQPLPGWIGLSVLLNSAGSYSAFTVFNSLVSSDSILFASTEAGVSIFNVSVPSIPQLIGMFNYSCVEGLLLFDEILFATTDFFCYYPSLLILNVSNPAMPEILNIPNITNEIVGMAIANDLAFLILNLNNIEFELGIFNASFPTNFQRISQFNITNNAIGIATASGLVIIPTGLGFEIFDVSDPVNPQLLISYRIDYDVFSFAAWENTLALSSYSGFYIFDISNPTTPVLLFLGTYEYFHMSRIGNVLFAQNSDRSSLSLLDVGQPSDPQLLASYSFNNIKSVTVAGQTLFVSTNNPGFLGFNMQWRLDANPNSSSVGNWVMQLVTTDRWGGQASDTFNVYVLGPPLVYGRIPLQYAPIGMVWNFFVSQGLFVDPNSNPLTFLASFNNSVLPTWVQFSSQTGSFTGIPQIFDQGTYNVTIGATDGIGVTNIAFLLFVGPQIPQPPVFRENRVFAFQVPEETFAVGDGQIRNYSAIQSNGVSLPNWLSFDNQTLQFQGSYFLNSSVSLTLNMYVVAIDGNNDMMRAPLSFVIVQNSPLQINPISVQTATVGNYFNFFLPEDAFINPNGYTLNYSASQVDGGNLPDWLSFSTNSSAPVFSGTPGYGDTNFYAPKSIDIKLSASDGVVSGSTFFMISVGGMSYMQLAVTVGSPLVTLLTTVFALYELRGWFFNRFYKDDYKKAPKECSPGEEIKITLETPWELIEEISYRRPPAKASLSCLQRLYLPRDANSWDKLPPGFFHNKKNNTVTGKIPMGEIEDGYLQVSGKVGTIFEEYPLKIKSETSSYRSSMVPVKEDKYADENDSRKSSSKQRRPASIGLDSPLLGAGRNDSGSARSSQGYQKS